MSLYRKHRPQQFSDVVGQDHIKTTLANALRAGTFSHAYVFRQENSAAWFYKGQA